MNDNNFSELFEKFNIDKNSISPDMINNLLGMLNNTNVAEEETHKEQSSFPHKNFMARIWRAIY